MQFFNLFYSDVFKIGGVELNDQIKFAINNYNELQKLIEIIQLCKYFSSPQLSDCRSSPAQKAFPFARSTTMRTSCRLLRASNVSLKAFTKGLFIAFSSFGRFRVNQSVSPFSSSSRASVIVSLPSLVINV